MTTQNISSAAWHNAGPVDTGSSPFARWRTLALDYITLRDGFWKQRQTLNREASLAHGFKMLQAAGNLDNFRIAAGLAEGKFRGYVFQDSDVYKWLEAVAWELHNGADAALAAMAEQVITLIVQAQCPDGYLDTYYQIAEPDARWTDFDHGHEMYCAGHLMQAAVAFQRALNDDRLLRVARGVADHLDANFGPGKREEVCGHPEIELALVELYRLTRDPRYLNLAQFFIDQRGQNKRGKTGRFRADYFQDHVPVRQVQAVTGHAVRQLYLTTGVADLYLERGEPGLRAALERLWQDMAGTKLYLTGGVGARHDGEAFGDPYELPSDEAYCETCAGIANFMWNWRMLLMSGASRYADLMERVLYNNILASVSPDGCHYFYTNPLFLLGKDSLQDEGGWDLLNGRGTWYNCPCCPPNLMRLLASLAHYLATQDASGIQIHLWSPSDIQTVLPNAGAVALSTRTDYPWQGIVRIELEAGGNAPWQLAMRIPDWSETWHCTVNDELQRAPRVENGYLLLEQNWSRGDVIELNLALRPRLTAPNPRVSALYGSVALERGPLVYCFEETDQPNAARILELELDAKSAISEEWKAELLGGIFMLHASGYTLKPSEPPQLFAPYRAHALRALEPIDLTAVPYYAWGNRGLAGMRVWLPSA